VAAPVRGTGSFSTSSYECRGKLWKYPGEKVTWYFITLPKRLSAEIKLVDAGPVRHGFGALRVDATIGGTTWTTSIFPSSESQAYLLPVKAEVRRRESLVVGRLASLKLVVKRRA
jgi:hypothetical protein